MKHQNFDLFEGRTADFHRSLFPTLQQQDAFQQVLPHQGHPCQGSEAEPVSQREAWPVYCKSVAGGDMSQIS
jgi:hypothetical protein